MSTIESSLSQADAPVERQNIQASMPGIQPAYYGQFACIGAACENTCCQGMAVAVDQTTFQRYQANDNPRLQPKLSQFVQISANPTPASYAKIQLQNAACPFLEQQLCSIQMEAGEEYLGDVCKTYPRQKADVEAPNGQVVREQTLHLSCPEAARLALLNPEPMAFLFADTPEQAATIDPARAYAIDLLQNRRYSVGQRLLLLGHFANKLSELDRTAGSTYPSELNQLLEGFQLAVDAGLFDPHIRRHNVPAGEQLGLILDLIVARISVDYVDPTFLELYGQLTTGLNLTDTSTLPELSDAYRSAYIEAAGILRDHEPAFENLAVHLAFSTRLAGSEDVLDVYRRISAVYGICRTMTVGLAAHRANAGWKLETEDIIRAIQICNRALMHCTQFAEVVSTVMAGFDVVAGSAILTNDLSQTQRAIEIAS